MTDLAKLHEALRDAGYLPEEHDRHFTAIQGAYLNEALEHAPGTIELGVGPQDLSPFVIHQGSFMAAIMPLNPAVVGPKKGRA